MHRVTVAVDPPYDVVVGPGVVPEAEALLGDRRRVALVTETHLVEVLAPAVGALRSCGDQSMLVTMDSGEAAKSLTTVERLCRDFAAGGLLRGDAVVALGGGVVGDTAGFAAAVYHRGIAVVQVPTTLLAQVDAAIGGKTAVNLPEGKNLLGAFHQPVGVVADTALLASLPEQELRCGLGEVAKYALMPDGDDVADAVADAGGALRSRDPDALARVVAASAAIKARVVAADPEERSGIRATLNYGHTLAHALETTSEHALAHGEAVAIGLVFAANLAHALERVDARTPARVEALLVELGLPTRVPTDVPAAALVDVMRRDKKARGGLTFVLPGADGLAIVEDPPEPALEHALRSVGVGA